MKSLVIQGFFALWPLWGLLQIDAMLEAENPIQRCRHHKLENVRGYLPEPLKEQTEAAMRAAFQLPPEEGMARLDKQAEWLERSRDVGPAPRQARAKASQRCSRSPVGFVAEPLAPPGLDERHRKPAQRRAVAHPQGLPLARREDGAALGCRPSAEGLMTGQNFRKIMGYRDMWILKGALGRKGVLPQPKGGGR